MAAQSSPVQSVKVPREIRDYRIRGKGGLKYVERRPWKYKTQEKFRFPKEDEQSEYLEKNYDISVQACKVGDDPPPDSLITLEVAGGNSTQTTPRRVRRILIEDGYAWDGASGPTVDTRGSFEAALVHDVLYQCMRLGYVTPDKKTRKAVDRLFLDMLRLGGMRRLRSRIWYGAVRVLGKKAATKKPPEPEPRKGHTYLGIALFALGIAGLAYWSSSTWLGCVCSKWQLACLVDRLLDSLKGTLGDVLVLLVAPVVSLVLAVLGYELWRGDDKK